MLIRREAGEESRDQTLLAAMRADAQTWAAKYAILHLQTCNTSPMLPPTYQPDPPTRHEYVA